VTCGRNNQPIKPEQTQKTTIAARAVRAGRRRQPRAAIAPMIADVP
jgi:hypothetical protein